MKVCGHGIKHVGSESLGSCTCALLCSCTKLELVMLYTGLCLICTGASVESYSLTLCT